jgi:hypothetical protein
MAHAPNPMRVMDMSLRPNGRVGKEVVVLMRKKSPAGKTSWRAGHRWPLASTIALSQAVDFPAILSASAGFSERGGQALMRMVRGLAGVHASP